MTPTQEHLRQDRGALEAELREAGAEIRGNAVRCPFHDDRHASGSVFQAQDGVWRFACNALSCGVGGDVFDIRSRISGRPLADVLREVDGDVAKGQRRPAQRVFTALGDLRLAVSRGGQTEGEYAYVDPDSGRTDLLIFRLKTPDGKQFRQCHPVAGGWSMTAPPKPWPLYNRAEIRGASDIVVVEGEKCVEALRGVGLTATTSPAGAGKAGYADWSPLAGKNLALWPDFDDAGRQHMREVQTILDRLDPAPSIRVIEPSDLDLGPREDAADFVAQCHVAGLDPADALHCALSRAKSLNLSSGLRDRIEDTISGKWANVPWPWAQLTRLAQALVPQTVTVLCGTPGAAKSFMVFESLLAWFDAGIPVACLALEEDRTYHLQRILAIREHNVELLDPEWQKTNADGARAAYARHQDYLDRFGRRIWDAPLEPMGLDAISGWIRDRAREGCRVVVVDPITAALASDTPWVADSKFVNNVKAIMRSHDASLLLVTHPRKGSGRAVGLDDLAGGAVYQRLSQCILWAERHPKGKNVTILADVGRFETEINQTVHICKARNGRGHGMSLGFRIDWPTLGFAEQGIVLKEK